MRLEASLFSCTLTEDSWAQKWSWRNGARKTQRERSSWRRIPSFFFAAFILPEGQSVPSIFGESPNNDIRPDGRFRIKTPAQTLYKDLPPKKAEYWASKIIDQSYAVKTTKLTHASYRYVPSTYVVCENDQGPPPQYQEMFAKSAGATVLRIASGHSPMLSKTEELANMVAAAAQGAMKAIS